MTAKQRERIEEAKDNQVILLVRLMEKGPCVINVHRNAWGIVRPFVVESPAETENYRIDLDRIDVRGSVSEGRSHVVAGACPYHQHFRGRPNQTVRQIISPKCGSIEFRCGVWRKDLGIMVEDRLVTVVVNIHQVNRQMRRTSWIGIRFEGDAVIGLQ